MIDRLITLRRAKKEVPLLSFRILQSEITEIVMYRPAGFIYKSGQYVKVACLGLNKKEFHPFTITSSPQDDFISLHIRAIGKVSNGVAFFDSLMLVTTLGDGFGRFRHQHPKVSNIEIPSSTSKNQYSSIF